MEYWKVYFMQWQMLFKLFPIIAWCQVPIEGNTMWYQVLALESVGESDDYRDVRQEKQD